MEAFCYTLFMTNHVEIQKAGAVIIRDRKLLVTRTAGKDFFIAPGGKLEQGETPHQALKRELQEEIQIDMDLATLEALGTFYADATGSNGTMLEMHVFIVHDYTGEPTPSSEIEEIRWISSQDDDITIGSIFEHYVIPLLKTRGLID